MYSSFPSFSFSFSFSLYLCRLRLLFFATHRFNVKALFRKLATALPGLENSSMGAANANLTDVKLMPSPAAGGAAGEEAAAASGGCGC